MQTSEDLSGAEGQSSQAQAKPPYPPPAERESTQEAKLGSGRATHRTLKRYPRHSLRATTPSWGAPATSGDPTTAEAEGVAPGNSGVSAVTWAPPDAHPGASELRMPTSPLAPPGPPVPEEASTGEDELCSREVVPLRRAGRRVQPVFRIIYAALGEPRKAAPLSPCASEARRAQRQPTDCSSPCSLERLWGHGEQRLRGEEPQGEPRLSLAGVWGCGLVPTVVLMGMGVQGNVFQSKRREGSGGGKLGVGGGKGEQESRRRSGGGGSI